MPVLRKNEERPHPPKPSVADAAKDQDPPRAAWCSPHRRYATARFAPSGGIAQRRLRPHRARTQEKTDAFQSALA